MRRPSIAAALFVAVWASVAGADDGSIGLYADAAATRTHATLRINQPTTLYLVARLEGATADGATGFEFRVAGFPSDWLAFVTPNPVASLALGDPLRVSGGAHRANLAFSACQPGRDGMLLLYTVLIVPTSIVTARTLTIEAGDPPSDPSYTQPMIVRCDPPHYTQAPAASVSFTIDEVQAPQDLDYSLHRGFDGNRGVQPVLGPPGEVFRFRVAFSSGGARRLATGQPVVNLDANGDGDSDDAGEGAYVLAPADLDSTFADGKDYVCDVALAPSATGIYRYRFSALDTLGEPLSGAATAWNESLFVRADLPDLVVRAEDVFVGPGSLNPSAPRQISVRFANESDAPARNVVVRIENAIGGVLLERTLAQLSPRGIALVSFDFSGGISGLHPLIVKLDPANAIAEIDETNNTASHGVHIGVSTVVGDLAIEGLTPVVSMQPLRPFAADGAVRYVGTVLGTDTPAAGARVRIAPSWDAATDVHTDANGAFALDLRAPLVPGSYSLLVVASDAARSDSVNVSVSVAPTGSLPHGPNLVPEVTLVPANPCAGDALAAHWSVRNTGDRSAEATTVRLEADGVTVATEQPIGPLAPGAAVTLPDASLGTASAGNHWATARVDPGNVIVELRDDDGARTTLARSSPTGPDLGVDSLRFAAPPCAGTPILLDAWIQNHGCAVSSPTRLVLREDALVLASVQVPSLSAGTGQNFRLAAIVEAGCHTLEAAVDPDSLPGADVDAARDVAGIAVCVQTCTLPPGEHVNYQVGSCELRASQTRPQPGEPIVFSTRVHNTGFSAVAPVAVRFYLDQVQLGGDVLVGPIAQGQVEDVVSVPWPADFLAHTLRVVVDPGNAQPEDSESDNEALAGLPYQFGLDPMQDCPAPGMFSSCGPCVGDPVGIQASVRNRGLFAPDSVRVEFRDVGDANALLGSVTVLSPSIGDRCFLPSEPIGISHVFSTPGSHLIEIIVDPSDTWDEIDESDNHLIRILNLSCTNRPDLSVLFEWPPGTVAPGDTVRGFDLRVNNLGVARALDVHTIVRLNGEPLCADLVVPEMPPQSFRMLRCDTPIVVPDPVSSALLEACVDPDSLIQESSENNNCAQSALPGGFTDLTLWLGLSDGDPRSGDSLRIEAHVFDLMQGGGSAQVDFYYELDFGGLAPIATALVTVPPGDITSEVVATWIVTDPQTVIRVFLNQVSPADIDPSNNQAAVAIPVGIGTPVVLTDLTASSNEDGVTLRWRALPLVAGFHVERRARELEEWRRLTAQPIATQSQAASYEFVDVTASPGARLEYRVLGVSGDGAPEVLGSVTVVHDAARATPWLHAAQPNPFRPGGVLRVSLPRAQAASLRIYDAAGREIASPWDGVMPAGQTEVRWNGADSSGRAVRSGVYFCTLRAGSTTRVRRLVLVR